MSIPKVMRALVLQNKQLSVREDIELPPLNTGEVLIKIHYSPINPSDLMFTQGLYKSDKPDPCIAGFEGSGEVVESGGGLMGWSLKGKRVGFATAQNNFYGAWGEYVTVPAISVVPLPQEVSLEQGCCCIVNPLTAVCMLETLQQNKHKVVISTAAASQLGRMMQRIFTSHGIQVINIVRRQEQVDLLKNEENAEFVLNSSQQDFKENFKEICQQLSPTACFDAVGGEQAVLIASNLKKGGTLYLYGALDLNNLQISPGDLIFNGINLKGWWLTELFGKKSIWGKLVSIKKLTKLLPTQLSSKIAKINNLEEFAEALEHYKNNMSSGKVLFKIANQ